MRFACAQAEGGLLRSAPHQPPPTWTPPRMWCSHSQTIVQRMGGELDRFQRERAQEMGYVLRDFAQVQARLGGDSARVWQALAPAPA